LLHDLVDLGVGDNHLATLFEAWLVDCFFFNIRCT